MLFHRLISLHTLAQIMSQRSSNRYGYWIFVRWSGPRCVN